MNLKDKTVEYQCVKYDSPLISAVLSLEQASIASSLIPHTGSNMCLIFPPRADAESLSFRRADICQSVIGRVPQRNAFLDYFWTNYSNFKTFSGLPKCLLGQCKQQRQHVLHNCVQATNSYQAAGIRLYRNLKMNQLISQ